MVQVAAGVWQAGREVVVPIFFDNMIAAFRHIVTPSSCVYTASCLSIMMFGRRYHNISSQETYESHTSFQLRQADRYCNITNGYRYGCQWYISTEMISLFFSYTFPWYYNVLSRLHRFLLAPPSFDMLSRRIEYMQDITYFFSLL